MRSRRQQPDFRDKLDLKQLLLVHVTEQADLTTMSQYAHIERGLQGQDQAMPKQVCQIACSVVI